MTISCPFFITRGHHATPTHRCAGQTSSGKIPARVKFRLTRRWPDAIRGLAKGQDERRGATLFLAVLPSCRLAVLPSRNWSAAMATSTMLTIQGYRDEPVPNRFLRREGAIDHLAVLLPGFGYTLDMPLFYYAEHLLLERGWDVLRIEYAYNKRSEFQTLPGPERDRWLLTDTTAAWRAGLGQRTYERVVLIGKSLGTLAMGHLLTLADLPPTVGAVWLTPLLSAERLRQQIQQYGGPSLFVIGTADPQFEPVLLEKMQVATVGEAVVVRNADHGMDIPGDPIASVRAIERVVEALGRFLA